jgi:superfamily II DNA or RNA helicase
VLLEEITKGSRIRGLSPSGPVTVIDAEWMGVDVVNLVFEDPAGRVQRELVYRDAEAALEPDGGGRPWSLDADAGLFLLASEAKRIELAYLFDPYLAAETADVEALPHQIDAVYGEMLDRQPLRFLLADDPGAGKTVMAGLLIKELIVRGDLERCLVVAPGGLVEQWQDELGEKFGLEFELLTRDLIESSRTANPFAERPLLIARIDMLARNDELVDRLGTSEWDLIVVDEAHKMSAKFFGDEVKETRRYRLGRRLGGLTRHLLLMTATPHNGHAADFQLFMALLDPDRFAGRFRKGSVDDAPPRDLMRRMVKEELLRLDGTKLFPERIAYTASYPLSPLEQQLYEHVSDYVREGMNRAERLDGGRRNVVGFALTVLQRRLASSPHAILRSLERRHGRLADKLHEATSGGSAAGSGQGRVDVASAPGVRLDDFDDFDADELLDSEVEDVEEQVVDSASAAATVAELEAEILELADLVSLAAKVVASRDDRKWNELARLLTETPEMLDSAGELEKLIIFTEHRDTLDYLVTNLERRLGFDGAVAAIHGSVRREERRRIQKVFTQERQIRILVATDAAGEGLNLQRAHLMVNYDLPWNPNRIEQRFGRIHRIGQEDTCRLWNLVAADTREGQVFESLLTKLDEQRRALGGKVFDVLGEAFRDRSLRDLLIDAIRSEDPTAQAAKANEVIDATIGTHVRELIDAQSLLTEVLSPDHVAELRQQRQRAHAHKLSPFFISRFFLHAFETVGGRATRREAGRFEVSRVPAALRQHHLHTPGRLLTTYERVCFTRDDISEAGRPTADLLAPGHPLLDATIAVVLARHGALLQRGAVLVDPNDPGTEAHLLVYLESEIADGTSTPTGDRRVVSKRFEFVRIDAGGAVTGAGFHPFTDYEAPSPEALAALSGIIDEKWISAGIDDVAIRHAIEHQAPRHLAEVAKRIHARVDATTAAVTTRLDTEIEYWDAQALKLTEQEQAGKRNARLNSARARQRADAAAERRDRRLAELALERRLSVRPPRVAGAALVVPAGLVATRLDQPIPTHALDTTRSDRLAVAAVLAAEAALDHRATEMAHNNTGYDIETLGPDGNLTFIEVKGRVTGATDFSITASEILCALNNAERHILALVEVSDDDRTSVRYLTDPFTGREAPPGLSEHKRVLDWHDYWSLAIAPI